MKIPNAKLAKLITALAIDRAQRAARRTIAASLERKAALSLGREGRSNTNKPIDGSD